MLPPLPRCSGRAYSSLKNRPSVSAFPDSTVGSACTSTFSRFARRLLALRPAHSRSHQIRDRYPGASDISSPPCLPRLLPAGAIAGWALHPLENAALSRGTRVKDVVAPFFYCVSTATLVEPRTTAFASLNSTKMRLVWGRNGTWPVAVAKIPKVGVALALIV